MKDMSYDEVFNVIAKYASDILPFFADKFNRFPQGDNALMIANCLNDKADFFRTIDSDISDNIRDAAKEIIKRCG